MKRLFLVLTVLTLAAPAWSTIAYSRFTHPKGDYVIEYPSNWNKSYGLQTVSLRPPGLDGKTARVSLERYPLGKNTPAKPEDFEKELLSQVGTLKKLESQASVDMAGRKARRLSLSETSAIPGRQGQHLAGPLREIYFILPFSGTAYYVLKLEGIGEAFAKALPEFDLMARKLTLAAIKP